MAHNTQRKAKTVFTTNPPGERVMLVECRNLQAEAAILTPTLAASP